MGSDEYNKGWFSAGPQKSYEAQQGQHDRREKERLEEEKRRQETQRRHEEFLRLAQSQGVGPAQPLPIQPKKPSSGKSGGLLIVVGLILASLFLSSEFESRPPPPLKAGRDGNPTVTPSPSVTMPSSLSDQTITPPGIAAPSGQPALSIDWSSSLPLQVEIGEPLTLVLKWQPTYPNEVVTLEVYISSNDSPQHRTQISSRTAVRPGETTLSMLLPSDTVPGSYELGTVLVLNGGERREERVNFLLLPRRNSIAPNPAPQGAEIAHPDVRPVPSTAPTEPAFNENIYKGS